MLASTGIFNSQGQDWWYLAPESGQHVFFYSRKALAWLGKQHGYEHFGAGQLQVFSRTAITPLQRTLLRLALSRLGLRAIRVVLAATARRGFADADYEMLCKRFTRETGAQR